jgi:hypothetical protein
MVEGYLEGLNTQSFNAGDQLYLSGTTAGAFTATKPQAPIHLVYVGVVTKKSAGDGHVFVKVQNGYELDEIHDVQITSIANNDVIRYDSATSLWKNVGQSTLSVGTAVYSTTSGTALSISGSITKSQVSDFTSGTVASAGTAQQAGTAVYATTSGSAITITGSITKSQVSDFTSGTVANATTAGTSVYATNSGTAVYATTSGTALTITGDITKSQVSDFTSGTVTSASTAQQSGTAVYAVSSGTAVTISGDIAQSQVTNLVTDLSSKANLAGGNAFTGNQTIVADSATDRPVIIKGFSGQTANLLEARSSADVLLTRIDRNGAVSATYWGPVGTGLTGYLEWITSTPTFYSGAAATTGMIIKGAASQTGSMLQLQNSAGNITANFTAPVNNVNRLNLGGTDLSATFGITVHASGGVGQVIRAAATQSADLLQIQNSAASNLLWITSAGNLNAPGQIRVGTSSGLAQLTVLSTNAATIAQVVRGASGQTADLTQWQESNGNIFNRVLASGNMLLGNTSVASDNYISFIGAGADRNAGLRWGNDATGSDQFVLVSNTTNGDLNLNILGAARTFNIKAAASQSANLTEWQNSAATILSRVEASGKGVFDVLNAPNGAFFGNLTAQPGSPSAYLAVQGYSPQHRPFMVRGFGNMTANLVDYQNGSSVVVSGINGVGQTFTGTTAPATTFTGGVTTAASGNGTTATITTTSAHNLIVGDIITVTGITPTGYNGRYSVTAVTSTTLSYANATTGSQTVAGAVSVDAQATIVVRSAGSRGLIVRGASGQAVPPLVVQDNAGSTLAQISSAGNVQANGLTTLTSHVVINEANAGGQMSMTRQTTTAANPGANQGRIYFRDGTIPGTLKLVVRAGAAGAETTILDNIPQ